MEKLINEIPSTDRITHDAIVTFITHYVAPIYTKNKMICESNIFKIEMLDYYHFIYASNKNSVFEKMITNHTRSAITLICKIYRIIALKNRSEKYITKNIGCTYELFKKNVIDNMPPDSVTENFKIYNELMVDKMVEIVKKYREEFISLLNGIVVMNKYFGLRVIEFSPLNKLPLTTDADLSLYIYLRINPILTLEDSEKYSCYILESGFGKKFVYSCSFRSAIIEFINADQIHVRNILYNFGDFFEYALCKKDRLQIIKYLNNHSRTRIDSSYYGSYLPSTELMKRFSRVKIYDDIYKDLDFINNNKEDIINFICFVFPLRLEIKVWHFNESVTICF